MSDFRKDFLVYDEEVMQNLDRAPKALIVDRACLVRQVVVQDL